MKKNLAGVIDVEIPRETYCSTLMLVNRIRIKKGEKPLKSLPIGRAGQSRSCPIANAVGGHASGSIGWAADDDKGRRLSHTIPSPKFALEFMNLVDKNGGREVNPVPMGKPLPVNQLEALQEKVDKIPI